MKIFQIECVELFRKAGYQADTVNDEKLNGFPDSTIYSVCIDEGRVLVTLDLDFSNIRLYPPNLHKGIIVLRLANQSKSKIINKINQIMPILRQEQLTGCTWIVEENKIRIRSGVN
jgi:predicted nuclease of predicted toxin-antitoxin system